MSALASVASASPAAPLIPAATAALEADELQTILVTARRRDEPIQRTPVSVVSLSADELRRRSVTNMADLQYFVPNLTLAPSQNVGQAAGNAFIRGIGQEDFIAGSEPGVAFYVDSIYLATTRGTLMNLFDVERVEVLRGPQGTLFGRNAIGGAINLMSVKPKPERAAEMSAIVGSFQRAELRGVINEPLSDVLDARLSVLLDSRDGYFRRLDPPMPLGPAFDLNHGREGDNHNIGARLQLRWTPRKNLMADLAVDIARTRNNQGAIRVDRIDPRFGIFPTINQLIAAGKLPGPLISSNLVPDDFYASYAGDRNFSRNDSKGISATVGSDFRLGTLKLILAWRNVNTWIGTDTDGLYFNLAGSEFRDRDNQYTGELQLNSVPGRLTYTAGIFALLEKAESLPTLSPIQNEVLYSCGCFFPPNSRPRPMTVHRKLTSNAYAIYGQGTYHLTDRLSATLGGRVSYEKKKIGVEVLLSNPDTLEPTNALFTQGANRDRWSSFTYRAGVEYQATPHLMAYSSLAKGYKAGGFNVRPTATLPNAGLAQFKPETALSYEIGIRSEWFARRLRLNATAFLTNYRDIQLRQQIEIAGNLVTLINNAARARIHGLELDLLARPTKYLTVGVNYGHIAARYLDTGAVPGLTTDTHFQRTPKHSGTATIQLEHPISRGTIELDGNFSYRSKEQFQLLPRPFDQKGYGLLGARIALRGHSDRWSVAFFGTNLLDKRYRTAGRGTVEESGVAFSSVGPPRQLGVQVGLSF